MTEEHIELSGQGFKFSYRRFVSDISAGVIVTLMTISFYYTKIQEFSQQNNYLVTFILVLLFFISIPVGFAINAISWFIFGGTIYKLEEFWFERDITSPYFVYRFAKRFRNFLVRGTDTAHDFSNCIKFFGFKKENWNSQTKELENILETYFPDKIKDFADATGLEIFFRNMMLLSIGFTIIIFQYYCLWLAIIFGVLIFVSCLIISSIISFYRYLRISNMVYILFLNYKGPKIKSGEICKLLVRLRHKFK